MSPNQDFSQVSAPETAYDRGRSPFVRLIRSLGPGIITAALVFGPSKMTITSKLGSEYGYSMLWIVVVAITFMTVFTVMSAKIGAATNRSLLDIIRGKWGNKAAIGIGLGVFFVTTSFQAGNSVGVGLALAEATGTSAVPWIILFNVIGVVLLFFRAFYKVLENLMIALVALMLFAFVVTVFFARPDWQLAGKGLLLPELPDTSMPLVIAFFASCFSIVGAFYQSYLVQERIRANPEIQERNSHSIAGILILGIMSTIVMVCAAAVLHPQGIKVNSGSDMARALEPLFGSYASSLFLTGLFGASFSSLIGNATVGGTLVGDAFGFGHALNAKGVRGFIALVMVVGAIIAIRFGKLPLQLIVFAQSVTIFLVPFIGIAMYSIARDGKIMGKRRIAGTMSVLGFAGLVLIVVLAITNARELFF